MESTTLRKTMGQRIADSTFSYYVESGILQTVFDLRKQGHSQERIAELLTEREVANSYGIVTWTQATISRLLSRARKRGLLVE